MLGQRFRKGPLPSESDFEPGGSTERGLSSGGCDRRRHEGALVARLAEIFTTFNPSFAPQRSATEPALRRERKELALARFNTPGERARRV